MLGIGKLTAGAEDYYLGLTQGIEDYYVGIASPGQWLGSSQRLLGLSGEVDPDALRAIFAGHDPSWTPLIGSANRSVVAFDFTFKADKTVSLLHAFGGADIADAVEAGQTAAIQASLCYLEGAAVHTRRGHNGIEQIHGDGLIAASFRHYRNRNEEPHLHDHVLVPNMVQGADGRWSTLDARHLYTHAKTAGYVYQAVMRHELTERLGVEFGPVHNGVAPIADIPRTVVEAFSTRRAEILEHMESVGATSARAAQIATLQTRSAKDQEPDLTAVAAEWERRAVRLGFEPASVPRLLGAVSSRSLSIDEQAGHTAVMVGPDGLTANAAAFDRRDVLRSWCEAHLQGAPLSELQMLSAQTIRNDELVALHGERWTTRDLLEQEQAIIDAAVKGRDGSISVASASSIAAAIGARPTISEEQSAVARQLVEGGDGVSVLVAAAGTGKVTYLVSPERRGSPMVTESSERPSQHAPQQNCATDQASPHRPSRNSSANSTKARRSSEATCS